MSAQEIMGLNNLEMGQLREQLRLKGLPLTNSTLEVRVIPDIQPDSPAPSQRKLQLDSTDLQNVFGIYGQLNGIHVEQDSCVAYITFQDVINAFIAKMQLDKMPLSRDKASLQVNFKQEIPAAPKKEEEVKTQIKHTFA